MATINSTFAVSGHSRLPDHEALSDNRIHLTIDPQIPKIALETHPSVWTPTTFTIEMVKLIWTDDCHDCMVLDFASGSGILGIVAAKAGAKKVIFIDLNPQAIAISERNWQLNELPIEQCQLFQSNCFVAVEHDLDIRGKLHRIYANPPTFPGTIAMSPEESNGLGSYPAQVWNRNGSKGRIVTDALIKEGRNLLAPGGEILFVTTSKQGARLTKNLMEECWGTGVSGGQIDPLDYAIPWEDRGNANWAVIHRIDLPLADYYYEFLPLYQEMAQAENEPDPVFEREGKLYQKLYFIRAKKGI